MFVIKCNFNVYLTLKLHLVIIYYYLKDIYYILNKIMDTVCDITKPSITRLARRAGVKSVSDECFHAIRKIITNRLDELILASLIVNSEHQTKTLMSEDVYDSFSIIGHNVTQSNDLGTTTCSK